MLTSILRTIVPAFWGSFIGWALALLPVLEPLRAELLAYGDLAVPFISAIIIAAWYVLWRKVEAWLPDWLTRILLGSSQAPTYAKDAIVGEVVTDANLTPDWQAADRHTIYPADGK